MQNLPRSCACKRGALPRTLGGRGLGVQVAEGASLPERKRAEGTEKSCESREVAPLPPRRARWGQAPSNAFPGLLLSQGCSGQPVTTGSEVA